MSPTNTKQLLPLIEKKIERFLENHWKLKIIFITLLLGVLTHLWIYPGYEILIQSYKETYLLGKPPIGWYYIVYQSNHLGEDLAPLIGDKTGNEHISKHTIRLLLPILTKILFGKYKLVLLLQYFLGILIPFLFISILSKFNLTKTQIFLFLLVLSQGFVVNSFWLDIVGWGDTFAYFLLLIALLSSNHLIIGMSIFLACWTDERALLNTTWIYLFKHYVENNTLNLSLKSIIKNKTSVLIIGTILFYISSRVLFINYNDLPTHIGDDLPKWIKRGLTHLNIMLAIHEGFLLTYIGFFIILYRYSNLLSKFIYTIAFLISILNPFLVYDVNRSSNYIFPFFILSVIVIRKYIDDKEFTLLLGTMTILSLLNTPIPSF